MSTDPDEDLIEATIRRIQSQKGEPVEPSGAPADSAIPDDDPIEATIRRVQQRAGSGAPAASGVEDTPEGEYASASMDRIESMLKRVKSQAAEHRAAEQLAASEGTSPTQDDDSFEDPIEATIRRVQAQAAAQANAESDQTADDPASLDEDDDAIAATIRRVQAQAAAVNEQQPTQGESVPYVAEADDEDPIAATIRRVAEAKAHREAAEFDDDDDAPAPAHLLDEIDAVDQAILAAETNGTSSEDAFAPAAEIRADSGRSRESYPEPTPWPGRDERMLGEPATWEIAAQRLEQGLQDTQRAVRQMAARLDALFADAERMPTGGSQPAPLKVVGPLARTAHEEDDFDDEPRVSAMQFGAPPRPAIYRDPSPQTATAAELIEEPALEVEKPAARLRAIDADGNLGSHLPRQYRITVEDKRRGVDLVPLHRALQGVDNVKDMSLLSYSNGVAIVSIESLGALDPEAMRVAVERAMSRETKIEVHNEQTMVVKIQEE